MIIECKDCKKEISNKARKCPHCGNPIDIWDSGRRVEILIALFAIVGAIGYLCLYLDTL